MTLIDALDEIYNKFGFYFESLVSQDYEGIQGAQKIQRIMELFRNYPETLFAGEEIIEKELSLSGVQRPITEEQLGGSFVNWFRFGDFSGYIIERPA
jgi:hypothetical protein